LNSKHLDQKQQTTHSTPINTQLVMKHIAMIISQSVGGSCMLIMLKKHLSKKHNSVILIYFYTQVKISNMHDLGTYIL